MSSCGCGCETAGNTTINTAPTREMAVDLYYIDIDTCDRCQGASSILKDAVESVAQPLAALGVTLRLSETLVETAEQAESIALYTSPSIRIDGLDIQADLEESTCDACSSLPNQSSVDCRVWTYKGEQFTAPPKGLIVEALMNAAMSLPGPSKPSGKYVMPANLKAFFMNKTVSERGEASCGCS